MSDIGTALRTYLGSAYVNDFTLYGRNFRVLAQADSMYRGDIKPIWASTTCATARAAWCP